MRPDAQAAGPVEVVGVVDVLAQRRQVAVRARPPRRRGGPRREPGPNRGSNVGERCGVHRGAGAGGVGDEPRAVRRRPGRRAVAEVVGRQRRQVGAHAPPGSRSGQRRAASAAASRRLALRSPLRPVGHDGAAGVGEPSREAGVVGHHQHRRHPRRGQAGGDGVEGERRGQLAAGRRRSARPAATCRRPAASPAPARRTPARPSGRSCQAAVAPADGVSRRDAAGGAERVACTRRRARQAGTSAQGTSTRDEREGSQAAAEARLGVHRRRPDPQAGPPGGDLARRGSTARRSPRPAAASWCSTTSPTSTRCWPRTSSTTTAGCRATSPSPGCSRTRRSAGSSRAAGQIPVERLSRSAVGAFDAAVAAVRDGECVVVYPEGTLTRDPDLWPMTGKSGAARIALETGCPVIPVGQWGAQEMLPPYAKKPDLFPRKRIAMKAGDPVDLTDLVAQAAHRRGRQRGDRPDHGRDHRARRGAPRRDAAGRAVRPAQDGRAPDRQPQQEGRATA